jgi:hypothetical protein
MITEQCPHKEAKNERNHTYTNTKEGNFHLRKQIANKPTHYENEGGARVNAES